MLYVKDLLRCGIPTPPRSATGQTATSPQATPPSRRRFQHRFEHDVAGNKYDLGRKRSQFGRQSSASASSSGGAEMPIAFAVLRLRTVSNYRIESGQSVLRCQKGM